MRAHLARPRPASASRAISPVRPWPKPYSRAPTQSRPSTRRRPRAPSSASRGGRLLLLLRFLLRLALRLDSRRRELPGSRRRPRSSLAYVDARLAIGALEGEAPASAGVQSKAGPASLGVLGLTRVCAPDKASDGIARPGRVARNEGEGAVCKSWKCAGSEARLALC